MSQRTTWLDAEVTVYLHDGSPDAGVPLTMTRNQAHALECRLRKGDKVWVSDGQGNLRNLAMMQCVSFPWGLWDKNEPDQPV